MYRPLTYLSVILILAGLLTGCGGGGGTPAPAAKPTVTLTASQSAIDTGQGVTLSWSATNAVAVSTSNFNAQAVNGTMTLFPSTTIIFSITVAAADGSTATATATVNVTSLSPPSAVSGFGAAAYTPGAGFPVRITVTPNTTTLAYAVEDAPPAGWTVTNIDNGGTFDSVNNQVKWGLFFDATPRVLSYTAIPPANAAGAVTFTGTASCNGTDVAIIGDRTIGNRSHKQR